MIETIVPNSREEWLSLRKPTIGASEVAAVLGVHPYTTPFELWTRKSRGVVIDDNKYMRRGRILEPIAIDLLREERPDWIVKENPIPGGEFYRDLDEGISCTPDAFVRDSWRPFMENENRPGLGICQIKTIDPHVFRQDWTIDGDICLPPYVAIQAMQEAHLTGATWCCVAALVGFDLDLHIIGVPIHAGVIARIKRAVPDFLRRVRENDPPPPDYGRDGETIKALYSDDDDSTIDLSGNERVLQLVARRLAMKEIMGAATEAEKERETIDNELRMMLGNATRATLTDGRILEAKTVWRSYKAKDAYRTSSRPIKIRQHKERAA